MLLGSAGRVSTKFVGLNASCGHVLGVPTAVLYGEVDDLAKLIWTWGPLTREGRVRTKRSVLWLGAGME